ncbi:hypothetical protein WME98_43945 [Sorangium sp. So ce296]|uniref:hypothetical protein n=1 Tax=Sorangium sp. So ce296 TaxID=3133296 RepID=UPI003F606247
MMRSVGALGMAMGVGLFTAACGEAPQIEGEIAGPGLEATWDKPGTQDPNGTPKSAWHAWKGPLVDALLRPLFPGYDPLDPESKPELNPEILAMGFLDDPGGQEVFDHAFRCAVEGGFSITHGDHEYKGRGVVAGASSWAQGALPMNVITNVLECVIAFVNDKTDGVSVLLTGPLVNDDPEEHHGFIYGEAVWCANVVPVTSSSTGAVTVTYDVGVDVYVTEAFARGCGLDPAAALAQRYCYEQGSCGLDYKGFLKDYPTECVVDGDPKYGRYTCNGKPCTMTWLTDPKPPWCERPRRLTP